MPDIRHDFPLRVPIARAFEALSSASALAHWWTLRSAGDAAPGAEYELFFGAEYDWRATVTTYVIDQVFELTMTRADADWIGTKVRVQVESRGENTWVRFSHEEWRHDNEHYRVSNHCWAMYLRVLRRWLEHGEAVPYEERLDA
jgi:uncharacterized protein YndB with AHSA1/START domain